MKKKQKKHGWEYLKTLVRIFRVGIFLGGIHQEEFDGWEFSRQEFSWYRFFRANVFQVKLANISFLFKFNLTPH